MWMWFVVSKQIIKHNWSFSIIVFLFLLFCTNNESKNLVERKSTNTEAKKKLALVESKSTSSLLNIVEEDVSKIFELLQNVEVNNLWFINLKCSIFCLSFTFVFCFCFFTVYKNGLNAKDFKVRKKKRKKQLKNLPTPNSWSFQFLSTPYVPLLFQSSQLLVFDIFSNWPYYSTTPSIRDLRVDVILLHV